MTYSNIETSNDQGQPVRLYAFKLGTAVFRFTSSDQDIILNGYKWKATAIDDDGVKQSGDATVDTLTINCPSSIAPVALFQGTPPSNPITITIYALHEGDSEAITMYAGEVIQCDYPQPGAASLSCDAMAISMERSGLRLTWQRNCPYALYNPSTCKADKTAHAIPMTIMANPVGGNTIEVQGLDAFADGTMDGGFIEWDHPVRGKEFRSVEVHTGASLTMFGLSDGLYYGLAIVGYPGCKRTVDDCANKFNNLPNYGGIPDLPGKSPFDGNPVF